MGRSTGTVMGRSDDSHAHSKDATNDSTPLLTSMSISAYTLERGPMPASLKDAPNGSHIHLRSPFTSARIRASVHSHVISRIVTRPSENLMTCYAINGKF